jgi:hypothetical protein
MVKAEKMPDTRTTAIAITAEPSRAAGFLQASSSFFTRVGAWANDTAQDFGALVAALMGPAVFSGYALAVWSLASNLGWTSTFLFTSGPLSNWLVWISIAVLINLAASVLRRHTRQN